MSSKSSSRGKITVVHSVCGHCHQESGKREVDPRNCLLGLGENWLPKNTECRAGWCPTCTKYFTQLNIEHMKEDVIRKYWSYMAGKSWTRPVDPGQLSTSFLRSQQGMTTATAANNPQVPDHMAVAGCLYSLGLSTGTTQEQYVEYFIAAEDIRAGTLAWAGRLKSEAKVRAKNQEREMYMEKPLPEIPLRPQPVPYSNVRSTKPSSSSGSSGSAQRSVMKQVQSAIDDSLREYESASASSYSTSFPSSDGTSMDSKGKKSKGKGKAQFTMEFEPYSNDMYNKKKNDEYEYPSPYRPSPPPPSPYRTPPQWTPQVPPPRPLRSLARCTVHGHVELLFVDMTCDQCAFISLDESTVPLGSSLGSRDRDQELRYTQDMQAVNGVCSCNEKDLNEGILCASCSARSDMASRTGVAWI